MTTKDCYRRTRQFATSMLTSKMGVTQSWIDQTQMSTEEIVQEVLIQKPDVFFAECPAGPKLRILDVESIAKACKETNTIFIIDATSATPLNQRTLELGACLVTHSASKYLAGHNDVTAGVVVGKAELVQKVRALHAVLGGVLDPHAAYLVMRGVKTVAIRVEHQNSTALEVARYLSSVPQVEQVFYPGLTSHPDYDLAQKQMKAHGGIVSFVVRGGMNQARKFLDGLRIPYIGSSHGGVESLVEMPSIAWGVPANELEELGIPEGLVSFSCGLEDPVDLLSDLAQALKKAN